MAAHIVKPELLAQEIGQRASVNELAAVIQQPGDIRNGRRLRQRPLDLVLRVQGELVDSGGHVLTRQRPLDLVLRVHAASMRCAKSIVQLYLRVKGSASGKNYLDASNAPHFMTIEKDGKRFGSTAVELENGSLLVKFGDSGVIAKVQVRPRPQYLTFELTSINDQSVSIVELAALPLQ